VVEQVVDLFLGTGEQDLGLARVRLALHAFLGVPQDADGLGELRREEDPAGQPPRAAARDLARGRMQRGEATERGGGVQEAHLAYTIGRFSRLAMPRSML
jgi:hypothetical protein